MATNNKISTIADFKKLNEPVVIELRDTDAFGESRSLYVQVKQVSLLSMMRAGKLPNSLLTTATGLIKPDGSTVKKPKLSEKTIEEMLTVIDEIAKEILVKPTYEEIKDYLTDDMKTQLFTYTQGGAKELERFHTDRENS